jgi:hypothetical protein
MGRSFFSPRVARRPLQTSSDYFWTDEDQALLEGLSRIKGVAHAFKDEDEEREHNGEGEKGGESKPGGLQVLLGL